MYGCIAKCGETTVGDEARDFRTNFAISVRLPPPFQENSTVVQMVFLVQVFNLFHRIPLVNYPIGFEAVPGMVLHAMVLLCIFIVQCCNSGI